MRRESRSERRGKLSPLFPRAGTYPPLFRTAPPTRSTLEPFSHLNALRVRKDLYASLLFQTPGLLAKARTAHQSQLHLVVAWWYDLADWRYTVHDDAHLMGRNAAAEPERGPPCCQRRGAGRRAP